jgi:hypothetical protein
LYNVNEEELVRMLKPRFDKKQTIINQSHELIITTTQQEINELNPFDPQHEQQNQTRTTTATKSAIQRKKNEKFKSKKKHDPDFQNKLKRPIYYKYDYRKVRCQLADDNIHHTHQITINERKSEVMIGFASKDEQKQATATIKINYFSKQQYNNRWEQ